MSGKIKNHWVNFPQTFQFFSCLKNLVLESVWIDTSKNSILPGKLFMVTLSVLKQRENSLSCSWPEGLMLGFFSGEEERMIPWINFKSHKIYTWLPTLGSVKLLHVGQKPRTLSTTTANTTTKYKHTWEKTRSLCFTYQHKEKRCR